MNSESAVIEIRDLKRRYGKVEAVKLAELPTPVENEYLASMLAWERAPVVSAASADLPREREAERRAPPRRRGLSQAPRVASVESTRRSRERLPASTPSRPIHILIRAAIRTSARRARRSTAA